MQNLPLSPTADDSDTSSELDSLFDIPEDTPDADPFAFLNALLSDSLAAIEDRTALGRGRKALKDTRIMGAERAALEASVQRMELAREWKSEAVVACFSAQYCSHCGSENTVFSGMFQRQSHRSDPYLNRWQVCPQDPSSRLLRERKVTDSVVPVCQECVEEQGFAEEVAVQVAE